MDYGLLHFDGPYLILTETSQKFMSRCDSEEPNIDALREILNQIISKHYFDWLIFYDPDPEIFRAYLIERDAEWTNLLDSARLFNFNDPLVVDWWNKVLTKYEDYKESLKKTIGDVGEKLTYDRELKRVEDDGRTPAKAYVKWASNFSNNFGYDILSIRSIFFKETFTELDQLQIEVKSTDAFNINRYRFFVSKNEWKTASDNLSSYYFFCWAGIDLVRETAALGPFIIPAASLLQLFPKDQSEESEWTECRFVIDLKKYSIT